MARWLVVGGGLAGALAAEALWHAGEEVVQRDSGEPAASRVAAGMFNPASFRRIVEVWDAQEHLSVASEVYHRFERLLGGTYWHEIPVVRVFPNPAYAEEWQARLNEEHPVSKWIERIDPPDGVSAPHGAGRVMGSGWVDVSKLLDDWSAWCSSGQERLNWEVGRWEWAVGLPEGFDGVVDARGVGAVADLAQWGIQINPNHGEVLRLKPGSWEAEFILNVNKWLLPQPDGSARLGATYAWNILDGRTLENTPCELLNAFDAVLQRKLNVEDVAEHLAGLRPASPDRRPFVGRLSERHRWYSVLNGLGTRGVMVGPRAAKDLVRQLLMDLPARDLTNPTRFRSFNEI